MTSPPRYYGLIFLFSPAKEEMELLEQNLF